MSERILDSDEMNGAVQRLDEGQKFDMKNERTIRKSKKETCKKREVQDVSIGTCFWVLPLNLYYSQKDH
jgi:hypothetical protein